MTAAIPRVALTTGEPAGIGPDICIELAQSAHRADIIAIGDGDLLQARARVLNRPLTLRPYRPADRAPQPAGQLRLLEIRTRTPVQTGRLDPANSRYVLETLERAADGCVHGEFDAMVTAPVHKGVINAAGIHFTGHTEYLAQHCGAPTPVMLLVTGNLRVALATTHLPLAAVAGAITRPALLHILHVLHRGLVERIGIANPRILVLGLNPHAGEDGHLGREEIEIITPALETLRKQGLHLIGPVAADTAFNPERLRQVDAILAMYHDQGLPVLKHAGFGHAVNVTLGLPIIRLSVDHGTALELAGTGRAEPTSLATAIDMAINMVGTPGTIR